MVPFDTQSPMVTSGIRIGTAAITTRGFGTTEAIQVVQWIDDILTDPNNTERIDAVRSQINTFMQGYPLYS